MIISAILCYTKNRITCFLDHARVALFSFSAFFNSANKGLKMKSRTHIYIVVSHS